MLLPTSQEKRSIQSWNSRTDLHSTFSFQKKSAFFGGWNRFQSLAMGQRQLRGSDDFAVVRSIIEDALIRQWRSSIFCTNAIRVWSFHHDVWGGFSSYFHPSQGFMQDVRQPWINSMLLDNDMTTAEMFWFWEVLPVRDIMYIVVSFRGMIYMDDIIYCSYIYLI